MVTSWILQTKPDPTVVLNGILAGLVGITAGADVVSVPAAILIGMIVGILVVLSVLFWDCLRADDFVGAVSVHLVCGIWGNLATGIFGPDPAVLLRLIGIVAVGVACLLTSGPVFAALRMTLRQRVSREEEILGLDLQKHGMEAYPEFQSFVTK